MVCICVCLHLCVCLCVVWADASLLSSFASHILALGFQEHLTPLFRTTEDISRQQLTAAQEELDGKA